MITREMALPHIPTPVAEEIIEGITRSSAVLPLMRRLPNMRSGQEALPIAQTLPMAGFVEGDYGLKPQTTMEWGEKLLVPGEIAAIVSVPDAVLNDARDGAGHNLWDYIVPRIIESATNVFDRAVLWGEGDNIPQQWPDSIYRGATNAGNIVQQGAGANIYEDLANVIAAVENDGYDMTGWVASRRLRGLIRGQLDTTNRPLFSDTGNTILGYPATFVGRGTMNPGSTGGTMPAVLGIAGEWDTAVYAIREDMEIRYTDQGVISDDQGRVIVNLFQQDSTALRFRWRIAWQLADYINIDRPTITSTDYPFAIYNSNATP